MVDLIFLALRMFKLEALLLHNVPVALKTMLVYATSNARKAIMVLVQFVGLKLQKIGLDVEWVLLQVVKVVEMLLLAKYPQSARLLC